MNIIKEIENNEKIIGTGRVKAMTDYIEYCKKKRIKVNYSDIVSNNRDYKQFSKWFSKAIKPFDIMKHSDNDFSITLDEDDFNYDWLGEVRSQSEYGDGYDYEEVFKLHIDRELPYLNSSLKYDSESGMFCVYCNNVEKTEELVYELSCLYKDEKKMLDLIKEVKAIDDIDCDFKI